MLQPVLDRRNVDDTRRSSSDRPDIHRNLRFFHTPPVFDAGDDLNTYIHTYVLSLSRQRHTISDGFVAPEKGAGCCTQGLAGPSYCGCASCTHFFFNFFVNF